MIIKSKMSLLARARESFLKKKELEKHESVNEDCKEEIAKEDSEDEVIGEVTREDEDDIPEIPNTFELYEKKWEIAPFMDEISAGDLTLVPVECLFTHYILRYGTHCLYVALDNHDTGDDFEIYEFDFPLERGKEDEDPDIDFKEVESSLNSIEVAHFLGDRIKEGYKIFIPERKEFE